MSIRQLATQLGVSTNTVVVAYDRLVAAGVISSHRTAGFFVCSLNETAHAMPDDITLEAAMSKSPFGWHSNRMINAQAFCWRVVAALPPTWLQDAVPASIVQRALANSTAGMASRCPPQGLPELREQIAMLMRGIGIHIDAGKLLTCFGGTHAIDLICRSFLQAGDTVLWKILVTF